MRPRVYIGAAASRGGSGITAFDWDPDHGDLSDGRLAAETDSPSFLLRHPVLPVLYAVNEIPEYEGIHGGSLSAFSIDRATGALELLARVPTGGASPTHLDIAPGAPALAVANYHGPSVAAFPLGADGRPALASVRRPHVGASVHLTRQTRPHPHGAHFAPDGRALLVPDLGCDRVVIYAFDPLRDPALESVGEFAAPAGAGPRHLAFHPRGDVVYLVNELASTLAVLAWDARTLALRELETHALLPADFTGESTAAEVAVHPSGRFVYASNRGHDSLAVFAVGAGGRLRALGHAPTRGRTPRHFAIDASGRWLIAGNQDDDQLAVFSVDVESGALLPHATVPAVGPVCVAFYRS